MGNYHYSEDDLNKIRELAAEGMTAIEIGEALNRTAKGIRKTCRRYDIPLLYRSNGTMHPRFCGEGSRLWKQGYTIDKDGYRLMHAPDHPFANTSGYVREHRLVMEQVLERYLTPLEVVHHIDGDKLNNFPENLELFSKNSEHLRVELSGRCPKWTPEGIAAIQAGVDKIRKKEPLRKNRREYVRKWAANRRASKADALQKQRSSSQTSE